jgi:Tol biopolymer transport system component
MNKILRFTIPIILTCLLLGIYFSLAGASSKALSAEAQIIKPENLPAKAMARVFGSGIIFQDESRKIGQNRGTDVSSIITSTAQQLYLPLAFKNYTNIDTGKIVFVSERDGNEEIYSMNYDGSAVTRLTNNPTNDQNPDWSPDGSKIAFESDRSGQFEIYVMNADGSNQTKITSLGKCFSPQWSPEGTRIAFYAINLTYHNLLYTMNPDGSDLFQVTDSSVDPDNPYWSPDGVRIAFVSANPTPGIYVINKDGTNQSLMLGVNGLGYFAWSPDGSILALSLFAPPQMNSDLYLYHINSGITTRITNTSWNHNSVDWSPTGRRLIFHSTMSINPVNFEIYTITLDGGNLNDLSNNPAADSEPDWTK